MTLLPLLSERFARRRLRRRPRLRARPDDGQPIVLFVCTHTAVGPIWHLGGSRVGRGSRHGLVRRVGAGVELNPAAVEAVREVGIDFFQEHHKPEPRRSFVGSSPRS